MCKKWILSLFYLFSQCVERYWQPRPPGNYTDNVATVESIFHSAQTAQGFNNSNHNLLFAEYEREKRILSNITDKECLKFFFEQVSKGRLHFYFLNMFLIEKELLYFLPSIPLSSLLSCYLSSNSCPSHSLSTLLK